MTNEQSVLRDLDAVLTTRKHAEPDSSYVAMLHHQGLNKILEKVGEEATEVIIAAKDLGITDQQKPGSEATRQPAQALVGEIADLWFHTLVLLSHQGHSSADVLECLASRFGVSGHEEKASRREN